MQVLSRFLGFSAEYPGDRRADLLIGPVDAAYPAARPAHAVLQLRDHPLNVFIACLLLLYSDCPADPLVAGERGDILPQPQRLRVGCKRLSYISRQLMNCAARNF